MFNFLLCIVLLAICIAGFDEQESAHQRPDLADVESEGDPLFKKEQKGALLFIPKPFVVIVSVSFRCVFMSLYWLYSFSVLDCDSYG